METPNTLKPFARCVTCSRDLPNAARAALHKISDHIVQTPERARLTESVLRDIRNAPAPRVALARSLLT